LFRSDQREREWNCGARGVFHPVETKTYALMRATIEGNDRSRLIKTRTGWSRKITQAIPLILALEVGSECVVVLADGRLIHVAATAI